MSSTIRGSARALGEATCNGIMRRMVSIPRSILAGVSRVMNHGKDLIGIGGRNRPGPPQIPHFQQQTNFSYQDPSSFPHVQEEWAFLATFEQQYGTLHPFFYACQFVEALKIARDDHKFLFMYIHSPEHPFTPSFCRDTLCSEVVVQFLDTNFVCWGGLASRGEGLHMAAALRASAFPFCAVVAPASGDNLAVLQQLEGPVSPAELVEILQRTMDEQGVAFGGDRAKKEEKRRADQRLREEQDVAYIQALQIDQEKERLKKNTNPQDKAPKPHKLKDSSVNKQSKVSTEASQTADKKGEVTQILIRFPNGERKEHSFLSGDKIQAIYNFINISVPGQGNYRLISNFPRKVYGVDQMGMSLKEAGFHPKASLFLEPL